ncbi:hypothetical protein [Williamsia sp. CHRR-6]|uniref:hypothetical protein n=1 Tax=Williamsia sp. CHRR-6 TaxID=2835871 RepID=UPI001BDAA2F7|nr:hypothetical protein [Williamsia sp. CHRR-6]MBT0566105.1 hypothetical protein [Williamsia sp. CHRR-6]
MISQIVTPAQATKISAQAAAEALRIQSEAAAANNRITLDQQLIEQMPLVIQALAGGVAKADQTVLNGAE